MRTTTIWAASMAIFCAPLLTTAYAAPAPNQPRHVQKRYYVPVRRAVSEGGVSNNTPASAAAALEPSAAAASQAPAAVPSTPASVIQVNAPVSQSVVVVPVASIPSEPSISPAPVAVPSVQPQAQAQAAPPSSEAMAPALPSSELPPAPSASAPAPASVEGVNLGAIVSNALPSDLFPSSALALSNAAASIVPVSDILPSAALPSDVLSSILGAPNALMSSIALPTMSVPDALPSSDAPIVGKASNLAQVNAVPSSAAAESSGFPLAPILDPSQSASQIIVGLNTIISDALPKPSAAQALGINSLAIEASASIPIINVLPTGSIDPLGAIISALPSQIVQAIPSDLGQIVASLLPSDLAQIVHSLLPSDIGPIINSLLPSGVPPIHSLLPSNVPPVQSLFPTAALPIQSLQPSDIGPIIQSLFPSNHLPTGGFIPEPTPSAVLPSEGGFLPSQGLPATPGVLPSAAEPQPPTPSSPGESPAANPIVTASAFPPAPAGSNGALVAAIGSDSNSGIPLATAIVFAPADAPKASIAASSLPKVIQPPGGKVSKQANQTLVQFGFLEPLNYQFVSANEDAINQIFQFIPLAVQHGIDSVEVQMQSIQPYDTLKTLNYMTTLAMLYVPSDSIPQLTLALHSPGSNLYSNSDSRIQTLMTFINPGIPLLAGQAMDVSAAAAAGATYTPGSTAGADPFSTDSQSNNPVNKSSAAIATPLAVGAVVYGCAMIFVARRYKQRRQKHRRASSLTGEPAWMTEARAYNNGSRESHSSGGNSSGRGSARTQQISAPLTSSNSLGW
jgi:hypothetical protein